MNIADAQRDMRQAHYGGATGLLASGSVWLAAGAMSLLSTPGHAILTLILGGMLIFPLSVVVAKVLGRRGFHTDGNPLAPLALEGTFWLLLAIPLAYGVSLYRVEWFFPAMLLTIGGRYLTFATLYGMRVYWSCGATLALAAVVLVFAHAAVPVGAFAGGVIEYVFAAIVFAVSRRRAA
jgi:hypothetical protein